MDIKKIKLAFTGSAGQGKAIIAKMISEKLGLPLLKSPTREVISEQNYDYSSGTSIEKWLVQNGRQLEILKKRVEYENEKDFFVADKSCIDIASYILEEQYNVLSEEKIQKILNKCYRQSIKYTHIIFFPWDKIPLKNNNVRTNNKWYQFNINSNIKDILSSLWDIPYYEIESTDAEERVDEICSYIKEKHIL